MLKKSRGRNAGLDDFNDIEVQVLRKTHACAHLPEWKSNDREPLKAINRNTRMGYVTYPSSQTKRETKIRWQGGVGSMQNVPRGCRNDASCKHTSGNFD